MPFELEKTTQVACTHANTGGGNDARARFDAKHNQGIGTTCWEWLAYKNPKGYGTFAISRKDRMYAHRASWLLHRGEIPKGMYVLHRCDNPSCVNPEHLFLGTARDNTIDMLTKGRGGPLTVGGERSPVSKLTDAQVVAIRLERSEGAKLHVIAARHGVTNATISRICAGLARCGKWSSATPKQAQHTQIPT